MSEVVRMPVDATGYVMELQFRVSNFSSSGVSVTDTSKPESANISHTYSGIQKTWYDVNSFYNQTTIIQIKRFAFKTVLSATNSDTSDHTLHYEITVDGTSIATGNFVVPASGSASKTITYDKVPTDNTVEIEIYLWADTGGVITVDETTDAGVGSASTSEQEVIQIYAGGKYGLYVSFQATGTASYTWVLRSFYNDVKIAYYTDDDLSFTGLAPYLKICLYSSDANEIAVAKGITLIVEPLTF